MTRIEINLPQATQGREYDCHVVAEVTPHEDGAQIRIVSLTQDGQRLPETWTRLLPTSRLVELEEAVWAAFEEQERHGAPVTRADAERIAAQLESALTNAQRMPVAEAYGAVRWALEEAARKLRNT